MKFRIHENLPGMARIVTQQFIRKMVGVHRKKRYFWNITNLSVLCGKVFDAELQERYKQRDIPSGGMASEVQHGFNSGSR
ncbi:MAG: hypothetical protein KDA78_10130 [Planctomycetaceae bacterium]|nr:hypothetical protein [Planctomycetaceae bacterium]